MYVGCIGLGAMGAPMARNLHKAGLLAGVWNRTTATGEALAAELGVRVFEEPAALARACDVILLSVSADADVLDVLDRLAPGLQPGAVVVDTSTVSVDTVHEAARRTRAAGGDFLDAPVSGGVEGARAGSLVMMVGGSEQALDRARPALEACASNVVHMGAVGSGQATKAVNQVMAAGINQAVTEALAFGEALGLDMEQLIEVTGSGAAASWFLQQRGPSMIQARFEPGFKVGLHLKDLEICRRMAQSVSAGDSRLPVLEMTRVHYQRLVGAGHGDEDISSLYRLKRGLFRKGG